MIYLRMLKKINQSDVPLLSFILSAPFYLLLRNSVFLLLLSSITAGKCYSLTFPLGEKRVQEIQTKPSLIVKKPSLPQQKKMFMTSLCQQLETEAINYNLPPTFFARLIWTESRFNPNAVSPMNAQGIAQFIPATASRRGLDDPFEVKQALKASAWFLSDLRNEFGNIGLAAAAYNAGEQRIRNWIAGRSRLPSETIEYVYAITGILASTWKNNKNKMAKILTDNKSSFQETCQKSRIHRFILSNKSGTRTVIKWQPWGVHLAENFSQQDVMKSYEKIKKRFFNILKGQSPMVLQRANPSFGSRTRYSVIMGCQNRSQAQEMCQELRGAGGVCIVVKN